MKPLARQVNAVALPYIVLHQPSGSTSGDREGTIVALHIPAGEFSQFKSNLDVVLKNPGKRMLLDPNGFVLVKKSTGRTKEEDAAHDLAKFKRKEEKLAVMSEEKDSLFSHLMKVAGVNKSNSSGSSGSSTGSSSSSGSSGNSSSDYPPSSSPFSPSSAKVVDGDEDEDEDEATACLKEPHMSSSEVEEMREAKAAFLRVHGRGGEYGYGKTIDEFDRLYAREVGSRIGQV